MILKWLTKIKWHNLKYVEVYIKYNKNNIDWEDFSSQYKTNACDKYFFKSEKLVEKFMPSNNIFICQKVNTFYSSFYIEIDSI